MTSRRPASTQPTSTQPKSLANVSLEEWEEKAPLDDLAKKSIDAIKSASEHLPYPAKFEDEAGPSRPSTPRNRLPVGAGTPRIGTPISASASARSAVGFSSHALHPKQPVETPQQFHEWFSQVDRSVARSQEAHFRAHMENVTEHLATCDSLVGKIEVIDQEVSEMLEGWRGVEEGGKSLKEACEKLLEERDRLLELTDEIDTRIEYFQELEQATRMLNHPGESLVLQTDFLYMVERVDVCIEYLQAHRQFREAEIYLFRYQQCMTRAMTLIKMYFVGSLRALTADISKRLSETEMSSTAQMHLLYTRFISVSQQLVPLLNELERRARAHPQELSALLQECHQAYFGARKGLLTGRIMEEIRGLDPAGSELVDLTRAGCTFLKQLCTDEFELFRHFFNSGEDQLYQYLETLCDYLYDDLRPRILHEPRLTALCEVCTVLQALMVLDAPTLPDEDSDGEESGSRRADTTIQGDRLLTMDPGQSRRRVGLGRLHISQLLQMILQDAQTRLFFKSQSVIQSDIRYYVPTPEDLAYPEILVAARKPNGPGELREKESVSQIFRLPSIDKQDTWYPTLRKTVWVLSQLHDFVKPAIFEDIAQEAVSLCRQSLVVASETMRSKSALDSQLFLVRHLLILKEITQNLDLVQRDVDPSIDFGSVTDTLANMLSRTTSLLPDALFASLGMPRSIESIKEAKHGIDHELRQACESIISYCSNPVSQPLLEWTDRVIAHSTAFNSSLNEKVKTPSTSSTTQLSIPQDLAQQSWATESAAAALDEEARRACQADLRGSVTRLRLYLEDDRTVRVLVEHVQDSVMEAYARFREVVGKLYSNNGGGLVERLMGTTELRALLGDVCQG